MRRAAPCLLLLAGALAAPARSAPGDEGGVRVARAAMPAVVRVDVGDGHGSGFVVDARGLIATNHHVAGNAGEIAVVFADGTRLPAERVATSKAADLCLLRVRPKAPLRVLRLADRPPPVGGTLYVLGCPYDYSFSVSRGVLSAAGRDLTFPDGQTLPGLLQTDAAINPGNSGGPVLDRRGEVVGVADAIDRRGRGLGFALPVSDLRAFLRFHLGERIASPAP